jgi:hypothetical protein
MEYEELSAFDAYYDVLLINDKWKAFNFLIERRWKINVNQIGL